MRGDTVRHFQKFYLHFPELRFRDNTASWNASQFRYLEALKLTLSFHLLQNHLPSLFKFLVTTEGLKKKKEEAKNPQKCLLRLL